jgi:hypothetical protein
MLFFNCLVHPTLMMRRQVLESVGFYPSGFPKAEDYALFMRLRRITRLANLGDVVLLYRSWPGSVSQRSADEQERDSVRIVKEDVSLTLQISISEDDVSVIRGLSRDRFPTSSKSLQTAGRHMTQLASAFVKAGSWNRSEMSSVRRSAGVRILQLAALAATRSPFLALSLVVDAIRLSPLSFVDFAGKIGRRLIGNRNVPINHETRGARCQDRPL